MKQDYCQSPPCPKITKGQNTQVIKLPLFKWRVVEVEWCGGDGLKPQNLNLPLRKTSQFYLRASKAHYTPLTSGSFPFQSGFGHTAPS